MMRRLLTTTLFICILHQSHHLVQAASASSDEPTKQLKSCTTYNPTNGNSYDLNTLTVHPIENHKKIHKDAREESWHARGWDYGVNFTMNFCAPVIEDLNKDGVFGIKHDLVRNISAYYIKGGETFSIGQTNTEPVFRGRKLVLNYTNGSPCDDAPKAMLPRASKSKDKDDSEHDDTDDDRNSHKSKPGHRRKSSLISFICDRESVSSKAHVSFIGASPDECAYFFEARTMAACGGVIATQQSLSPGGVFSIIALIAAAVYVLGGIAYQRTVMHQRGWRQLPNYALWAGIFGFVNDIFIIITSSCTRFLPQRRGYNQLPSNGRGRRDDEANGLIDSYEEDY